ncbi:hypothetical protein N0V84_003614 [Fusarium piperis]|uniref:Uncharacterized protein n=1 Tax=Fusarium piperis TaxID=1435070 RepID=A0A9W8WH21_9HYPO|nr:hypothetical protein N0V84_003614 [Fusarium piperis]
MKTTPLVLLSLGVLSRAGPVPEGVHPIGEVSAVDANLVARANGDSSARSRRKGRALGARNHRIRRRQRQFRRDNYWTEDDDNTDDDGHYTSCDEFPDKEKCLRSPHVQTTQNPAPVATTSVKTSQPATKALGHGNDTDNPDWETDCDTDWTDDGEYERCKAKTKTAPATTAVEKIPTSTAIPVTTAVSITSARSYGTNIGNPDYLTDCDSDWTDDGEHERCKTRTKSLGATHTTALTRVNAQVTTTSWAASLPTGDTDTDNPDYLTDCDSDWTDDGERERCRTKFVSVAPTATTTATATGSSNTPDNEPVQATNEPVQATNGAAGQSEGIKHAVAMAGIAAAAAFVM